MATIQIRDVLHPFDPYHERIWGLAANATSYDAWYVAVAERLLVVTPTARAGAQTAKVTFRSNRDGSRRTTAVGCPATATVVHAGT